MRREMQNQKLQTAPNIEKEGMNHSLGPMYKDGRVDQYVPPFNNT